MQTFVLKGLAVAGISALVGCAGKEAPAVGNGTSGGARPVQAQGGQATASGGSQPVNATVGGNSGVSGTMTVAHTGGTTQPGNATGGSPLGATSATGGVSSLGGTQSVITTAASPTGGKSSSTSSTSTWGGAMPTGGTKPTSSSTTTGGMAVVATGGAHFTGGSTSTGGVAHSGGAGNGGTPSTGGTSATGGVSASGGKSATGGTISTGTLPVWPKKFCGNVTTYNQVDPPGLTFSKHWDQITPENEGKWASIQSSATSAYNWSRLDAIYAYAEQNGLVFKESSLIWGAAQPAGSSSGAGVEEWIKAFCERYPKTALIDVVNEPPPHTTPPYAAALGAGESGTYPWITKSFKLARQYCASSAVLILNDYYNIEYTDQENHFIEIVKDIKANGAPIDAIGVEGHYTSALTASQLQTNMDRLHTETGLPIYITEYDVDKSSDADQLAIFQAQFPIFWNTDYVRGVTLWGWIYGRTWVSNSGLVKETTPRPAMTWLMDYLGRPTPP